ncbi:hypothetical protein Agub_g12505 [Astrephomene gubernaculifera]|uniref:Alpha-type protein kinase domain-containing protein n=1 Tax=Astrephomene gubernaculifera TaxID=47775 RepID=A0AAD3DZY6_9CHLO|nr:hypothetical protein Agub_g12505 [Astrephomene gubernaculifera]
MASGDELSKVVDMMKQMHLMGSQLGSETRQRLKQLEAKMKAEAQQFMAENAKKIMIRESQGLDLLFLLDVTVSMKPYRDGVVNQIVTVVSHLEAMYKYSKDNIRVGVVGYRDLHLEPRFELLPFTPVSACNEGCNVIKQWLNKLKFTTDKANDYPEDVHGGLEKAAAPELGWKSAARTIVHIADAPGHGKRLTGPNASFRDDFPNHDADGKELVKLLTRLRLETKVQTYKFIHILDPKNEKTYTRVMLEEFRRACGDPAWIIESDWQGDEEMGLEVIAAASESIQNSVSQRTGAQQPAPERVYTIDPSEPDWESLPAQPITITRHDTQLLGSIQTLLQLIDNGNHIRIKEVTEGNVARVRIALNPFAKGKNRLAYYGRYYPKGLGGGEVHEMVLKEFISSAGSDNSAVVYKAQLEAQTVASFLAEHFNKHAAQAAPQLRVPPVKYAPCDLACVPTGPKTVRFLLIEPLILGGIYKYNNNYGFVDLADMQPYLQAFSHWTYEVTDKRLMVVDLQGFRTLAEEDEVEVVLVDPAIHCVNKDFFPSTNLAAEGGFEAFLHSHMNPKFNAHGPICTTLLPGCCAYREQQHDLARAQRDNNNNNNNNNNRSSSGLWQGGRGAAAGANRGRGKGRGGGNQSDAGNRQQGRGRGVNALREAWLQPAPPSRPEDDPAGSFSSMSSTSSIHERMKAIKEAMDVHALCRKWLREDGIPVPSNLAEAINLCQAFGKIKRQEVADKFHARRVAANKARHVW